MRWLCSTVLCCCLWITAQAQSLFPEANPELEKLLQRSVVRVWWNCDLMNRGQYFRLAINGSIIDNVAPRFLASYETDAWVYDSAGHVVAYLGPAGAWMDQSTPQLVVQMTDGQKISARLIGIDESQGIAVVQAETSSLRPVAVQFKIEWKPYQEFYVATVDPNLSLAQCTLLNAQKQPGLDEFKLQFKKLRVGRPGNLVFTRDGQFAGILTSVMRGASAVRNLAVNLLPVDQIVPAVQKILRTHSNIKSGWLGLYLDEKSTAMDQIWSGSLFASGVVVNNVVPGGPAARAGITENDRILKVNDVAAENLFQVVRMIQKAPVGSTLKLEVARGDRKLQLRPIVSRRQDFEKPPEYIVEVLRDENGTIRLRRADDAKLQSRNAIFLGIYATETVMAPQARGLLVTEVLQNTPAFQAGLQKGDVIVQVNSVPVSDMSQYAKALTQIMFRQNHTITLRCLRQQREIETKIVLK
ncbi:MAG TPA: PDZ domain-containing protein [Acidobacteriota bacterium]|jgi:serine protease Do